MTKSHYTWEHIEPLALQQASESVGGRELSEREKWICSRFARWVEVCERFVSGLDVTMPRTLPTIALETRASKVAGRYFPMKNCCAYNIPYALLVGDDYDITIAHEVAHAYQDVIAAGKTAHHGEMFFFVLNVVMGVDAGKFHNYSSKTAKKIAKLLAAYKKVIACKGE